VKTDFQVFKEFETIFLSSLQTKYYADLATSKYFRSVTGCQTSMCKGSIIYGIVLFTTNSTV